MTHPPIHPPALRELLEAVRTRIAEPLSGPTTVGPVGFYDMPTLYGELIDRAGKARLPEGSEERTRGSLATALDGSAEADMQAVVVSWTLDALKAFDAGRVAEANEIARRALRMLEASIAVTHPPYIPLEIPWLRRLPTPGEIRAHALRHPVPRLPGIGLWLATSPTYDAGLTLELFVDADDRVRSHNNVDEHGVRGALLETLGVEVCRFLPLTNSGLPAYLLAPIAPVIDGAPIRTVPTAQALAALGIDGSGDDITILYDGRNQDLLDVIRERGHLAAQVTSLQKAATWHQLRARAFAAMLPQGNARCAACGWTGSPYSAQLTEEGTLLCPLCNLPALFGHEPNAGTYNAIFDLYASAVERAVGDESDWGQVLKFARVLVGLTSTSTPEGQLARRAAVRAALKIGDRLAAASIIEVIAGEPEKTPEAYPLAAELDTWLNGGMVKPLHTWDARRGAWTCCSVPICVCARAWGLTPEAEA